MKKNKKILIIILSAVALFLILFTPIPKKVELADGNAWSFNSITYKIISWNMFVDSEKPYNKTEFLILPKNFSNTEDIWSNKRNDLLKSGYGAYTDCYTVTQKDENSILVDGIFDKDINDIIITKDEFDKVSVNITFDHVEIDTKLNITSDGTILYTYPAMFGNIYKITPMKVEHTESGKPQKPTDNTESIPTGTSDDSSNVDPTDDDDDSSLLPPSDDQSTVPSDIEVTPLPEIKSLWFKDVDKFPDNYDEKSQLLVPYVVFKPENYDSHKKYPVILYLHGAGDGYPSPYDDMNAYNLRFNQQQAFPFNATYNFNYKWLDKAIIVMPQIPSGVWWDFAENETGSLDAAMRIFDKVTKNYSCDSSRYYVMGTSMGGYATYHVAAKYGDVFAAAAPMCAVPDFSLTNELTSIPLFLGHGTADTTVSVESSKEMYEAIKAAGNKNIILKLYEGVDHSIYRTAYNDPTVFEWLFAQKRI